ncbi:1-acyl-sn-glycerol-3-phosphate acyltransferase [Corynebacterium kalinowskii]|uniref:1-acyl-sn-glycerol-3-phosphate acyltransferase n=1 Tax=Corynebacterium kalinowskii TaxID=2675216 RepID=A0A6B8VNJ6_9CORY|nr:lysophospholipid acyltransferase family protein [Corynebacterium kalinowskii]QGU01107.1 1-acyl-sn-glycerol-3-phosphate acyltransferase [Corynebacterium kalinowskii]
MNLKDFRRHGAIYLPKGYSEPAKHAEASEPFYGAIIKLVAQMLRAQGIKVYIEGAENIPAEGAALIAVNHTGYFDFILSGVPAKMRGGRLVRFMAKKEIFDTPVVGWMMRKMRHISVDRSAGAESFDLAVEKLRAGNLVGIFPEATVSRSFEIKELKTGAARIAAAADAPLIPLILWGSQRIWTKDIPKDVVHPNVPILVQVGKPLELIGDPDVDTDLLHTTMIAMLRDVRTKYDAAFGPFGPGLPWRPESMGGSAPNPERAALLALEEKERRQAAREHKRAEKLRRLDMRADRKAMDVLRSRGWFGRMKARVTTAIEARRDR